ncbi:MAG: transglycosylase SLT domain-containing protein [Spirochaetes bacterium]|nr:transglycosylase SLT domain-containing protein [Spirochaetota bacterium]
MRRTVLLSLILVLFSGCTAFQNSEKLNFFHDLKSDAQVYSLTLPENHIPLIVNEKVADYIKIYNNGSREHLRRILERAYPYFPMMKLAFRKEGLPDELVYLPIIESGFQMHAYSPKHASGPWQFVTGTGKMYGLHCNWWVDERRNPEKSTIAAVRHLKDLYKWLKDWYLSLAAYNAGGGKVSKAIKKYKSRDYWELTQEKRRYIKKETKKYVPKFLAVVIICENLDRFGFTDIQKKTPLMYDIVEIPDATDLNLVAKACNTTYEEIKALNPELKKWATPPRYENYQLRIPYGSMDQFLAIFNQIAPEDRITFRRHKILKGETIWSIAKKYKIPRPMLKEMNNLGSKGFIREGKYLIIPIRGLDKARELDELLGFKNSIQNDDKMDY